MAETPRVAIVGGESLLGRELRDLLSHSILGSNLKLVGSEEEASVAILSEQAGEPVVITGVDEETLASSAVVFFAGTRLSTEKALSWLGKQRPLLIDLTHTLDEMPGARLRAPWSEPPAYLPPSAPVAAIAHPAAIVLSIFLRRLHARFPIKRSVTHVFEPASERGRGGINELHQQTLDLLSFRAPEKKIFDAQLSFNLLARYGAEAPVPLEPVELRIEKHLASLLALAEAVPMPSLRLIQAPVMHGHSISVWAELVEKASADAVSDALKGSEIDVYPPDADPPDVVGFAGQSGMAVGAIEADRNNSRAAWFWIVADNYRVAAENAIAVARGHLIKEAGK